MIWYWIFGWSSAIPVLNWSAVYLLLWFWFALRIVILILCLWALGRQRSESSNDVPGLIQFWSEKIGCSDLNLRLFFFLGRRRNGWCGYGLWHHTWPTKTNLLHHWRAVHSVVLSCAGMPWHGLAWSVMLMSDGLQIRQGGSIDLRGSRSKTDAADTQLPIRTPYVSPPQLRCAAVRYVHGRGGGER
jgi:hypothetical protein